MTMMMIKVFLFQVLTLFKTNMYNNYPNARSWICLCELLTVLMRQGHYIVHHCLLFGGT